MPVSSRCPVTPGLDEGGTDEVGEVGAAEEALGIGLRVLRTVCDAHAGEAERPRELGCAGRRGPDGAGHLAGVVGAEGVGQVAPRDHRDDRVEAGVDRRDGELDLSAVRPTDHPDARVVGVPLPVMGTSVPPDHRQRRDWFGVGVVGEGDAPRPTEERDQLAAGDAVDGRVVEGDLAVAATEPEAGVGEDGVAAAREQLADLGLVVLAAAEAVGGQDRGDAVLRRGPLREVEVADDVAVGLRRTRAHLEVQGLHRVGRRGGGRPLAGHGDGDEGRAREEGDGQGSRQSGHGRRTSGVRPRSRGPCSQRRFRACDSSTTRPRRTT